MNIFSNHCHLFLSPDEGFSQIVKLHNHLYTGILREHLKLEVPYIPHITLGHSEDQVYCKEIADRINREAFQIQGEIGELSILEISEGSFSKHADQSLFE